MQARPPAYRPEALDVGLCCITENAIVAAGTAPPLFSRASPNETMGCLAAEVGMYNLYPIRAVLCYMLVWLAARMHVCLRSLPQGHLESPCHATHEM